MRYSSYLSLNNGVKRFLDVQIIAHSFSHGPNFKITHTNRFMMVWVNISRIQFNSGKLPFQLAFLMKT